MSSLTLEQPLKLLGSNYRICLRCRKLFKRRPGISNHRWNIRHKMCSVGCVGADTDHKNGIRLRLGQHLFQCNVCGCEVVGNKKDMKKHKYEQHGH